MSLDCGHFQLIFGRQKVIRRLSVVLFCFAALFFVLKNYYEATEMGVLLNSNRKLIGLTSQQKLRNVGNEMVPARI